MNFRKYETNFRNFVVGADTKVPLANGTLVTAINFDNAATTPPLISVMRDLLTFSPYYSSIHRGTGYKSQVSSNMYDNARKVVLNFIGADQDKDTAIFVKNATEGLNKLAYRLCSSQRKCVILSSEMEHHSNDLPWRSKYIVDYIGVDSCGRLSLEDLERKLKKYWGSVKLVTVTGASNVTGYMNPIHKIAALAHKYNAKILVDGAQLIPHVPFDMKPHSSAEHIDFVVFSAHKMYAPFGIGVLVGPKNSFVQGDPDYKGGGTVKLVTHDYISWEDPPGKEEAGTPNVMGVVALLSSINTLQQIGMDNVEKYERSLTEYTLMRMKEVQDIDLYGSPSCGNDKLGIIPFNIKGLHHTVVAKALSEEAAIAVRSGCFCAHPYIQKLLGLTPTDMKTYIKNPNQPRPGMVRVSFGIYNNYDEVDILISMLQKIVKNKAYYLEKYS